MTADQLVTRTTPNEGIGRSLRNALIILVTVWLGVALLVGLLAGVGSGLIVGLADGLAVRLFFVLVFFGLVVGLVFGLVVGSGAGLYYGGSAYLKHYVLRFLLWRNDHAPWNYIQFLDYAAERVFLRKVGGGYIFTHRLLMEYFAALQPTDQARHTKTT